MAGFRIEGNTSGHVAEVDSNNNLKVTLPAVIDAATQAGAVAIYNVNDEGLATGTPSINSAIVSQDDRMMVGLDTPVFDYHFNAVAQDTGVWSCAFSAMTIAQTGGFALFNSNSIATAAAGCSLRTFRTFSLYGAAALRCVFAGQLTAALLANQIIEFGFFMPNTTSAPPDGVYFRITSAGITGVLNYNGTETSSSIFNILGGFGVSAIVPSDNYIFAINISQFAVEFWISGILMEVIMLPTGNAQAFLTSALPLATQFRNSGTVSGSPQAQWKLGAAHVSQREMSLNIPLGHLQSAMGMHAYQGISGNIMGSSELYTNNLAVGAGIAATNTTAALGSGLGGQFSIQPTLAVSTDGIISSFQNPAATISITPRILMITGVRIQGLVTTALTGGPVYYIYSLAYGHTAVALTTTESASFASGTTKAPRKIVLGYESYPVTAPVGSIGSAGVYMSFQASPIPVNPGEFIQICAKNVGTVTSAGVIAVLVTFEGYYF